ncbi:MAG: murein L,D-transpeptidase catalytic domain family protein [Chlorobiaceae bacterium]
MMRLMTMLLLILVLTFPSSGYALPVQDTAARKTVSELSRSPELKAKIDPKLLRMALSGYYTLKDQGKVSRDGVLTVIDFNRSSVDERLFVIDVNAGRLLYSGLVAHGNRSGENYAQSFSNRPGSCRSSLGFYTTGSTYEGHNGYSLKLFGLERGINDKAEKRSIVMHGADYVSYDYISRHGRLGRSQGCPAISFEGFQQVIDLIKDGSCLFIYQNAKGYAMRSKVLNSRVAKRYAALSPIS